MMDLALRQKFQPTLAPNEEVLWTGQPKQGLVLHRQDLFLIPVSIFWSVFAFLWITGAYMIGAPSFFTLLRVPFVLLALYMVIGRFFVDAYQRSKVFYALTNKRVIVKNEGFGEKTTSYEVRSLMNLSVETGRGGRGTILLGPDPFGRATARDYGWPSMNHYGLLSLDSIPDADQVYRMIHDLRDE